MSSIYLNGDLVPEDEARIPVQDRAILFGDGAYETMRSYAGKFFRFPEHLRRLRNTLAGIRLELPVTDAEITRGALRLIEANRVPDARLRLTVTGGTFGGEIRLRRSHPPNLILTATALTRPPESAYREGVDVVFAPWRVHTRSALPHLKTVNRLVHLMAKEEALTQGAWESLFLDETDAILEGTATNVFFVVDETLVTPPLAGPLLAGVTRDAVIEVARAAGIPCREMRVGPEELARAREGFLTSTTIEILPLRSVDGRPLGRGEPGPMGPRLHAAYLDLVRRELARS
jgi:branched-chain amino acid aminotransferase